ncbi:cyclic 2,3-diphospoglycerate synthetase [Thermococcus onnurineus NA1]|uniref:Cyclic 2,3-diphosphoglycerate synthetase n=1 Tax=Thermococcus onnurineus (strain NA1) TaxID=523850 RepID=CPGS_THEON|nr:MULTISPECIES: 2,3-phosphoglycerate synthetase [Thermococcus]B6YVF3.1 RecName: Full=Cyclic 2,3-diphosphoglycerate synthetase; Short=cDPGS [Thermococcus onnurineus NA1]ACJ16231.1 cyclic 2,3-diphospoglycerate synthetase [Thermococcus onnurineus NA1]NJE47239.1 2,3-diphosphoglycerate synthetase [Thermococcus sp. GR7]NJE79032.1 2,3-diphosphoglycerate synthetase [Thermococcus sp. GR4]NJF22642.1 2,3-diphosphoglycerate synthetase [Thermococcus sp. GR5]
MKLVLIDGEHYPDVISWAIKKLGDVCCAVFLGGSEKIGSIGEVERKIGVKVYHSPNYLDALRRALEENKVDEVVDLSDEPVLNYEDRFRIASLCMLYGVSYRGADFHFKPKPLKKTKKPSLAVIGTGKRVGKTAVSGFIARTLKEIAKPVIVTMGRGGPEEPELIEGDKFEITPEFLLKFAESGKHAASDHFEDALTSRVTTIGCRRCGGGMAGFPFFDVVDEGVKLAENLPNDLIILEGSGATFPPYRADRYVVVVGAKQKLDFVRGYFGTFRVSLADIVVVTMADSVGEERWKALRDAILEINPDVDLHFIAFRPRPLGNVSDKRLGLVMTSSEALPKAKKHLEGLGAEVPYTSDNLSKRPLLWRDLEGFRGIDAVAVELKAAAVDVVTRWALEQGIEVIYLDNEPVNIDGKDLRKAVLELGRALLGGRA